MWKYLKIWMTGSNFYWFLQSDCIYHILSFLDCFFLLIISPPPELRKIHSQVYVKKVLNFME